MYSDPSFNDQTNTAKVSQVNDPSTSWHNQEPHWGLIEDLMGGTYMMNQKGEEYLPQMPRESNESYNVRKSLSVCPPYYQRLERMLAGMLVRKPVVLDNISDQIREQMFNVDQLGNDLNVWTYETARLAIRFGLVGTLVDAPQDGGRPYWVAYKAEDILGARYEIIDGVQKMVQLRLHESIILPDGEYGEKRVEQVRVLTPGEYKLFRRENENSKFIIVDEGKTNLDEIPFAVAYSNRVATLEARPPLEDIARLNLKAYQVQSDLDNQLRVCAFPLPVIYGFPTSAEEVTAGPDEALSLPEEARMEFASPSSDAFASQFKRLEQIEKQINELGLSAVLGQKLSAETAEAKRIDRSQGDSTMEVIAQNMQDMIDNCLRFHAQMLGDSQPGNCLVNRDFLGTMLEPQQSQVLLQLYTAGTITQETLLKRLSEGEVLGDDFDVEAELEATAAGNLRESNEITVEPDPQANNEA